MGAVKDRRVRGRRRATCAALVALAVVALVPGCGLLPDDGATGAASGSPSAPVGGDGRDGSGRAEPPLPTGAPTPSTATVAAGPIVVEVVVPAGSGVGAAGNSAGNTLGNGTAADAGATAAAGNSAGNGADSTATGTDSATTTAGTAPPPIAVVPVEDGAQSVTVRLGAEPASLVLAAGSFVDNLDGTVTVVDAAGTAVGGFAVPEAVWAGGTAGDLDEGGSPESSDSPELGDTTEPGDTTDAQAAPADPPTASAQIRVVDPTHAEVSAIRWGATASGTGETWNVTTTLGAAGIRTTDWGNREGGRSLAVDPTAWARSAGTAGTETAWAQLVAAEPEANSATMRDQFTCHALGARDKATWNLEPWRPDVGLIAMAAARCNPT